MEILTPDSRAGNITHDPFGLPLNPADLELLDGDAHHDRDPFGLPLNPADQE